MAINLNPGADASIVTAATRAGLANVPDDYSADFQNAASSYAKTMQATSNMWKKIADSTASVAAAAFKKAKENREIDDNIANNPHGEETAKQIDLIKQEIKKTWVNGNPFSKENIKNRKEANRNKNTLYQKFDVAAKEIDFVEAQMNNGNVHQMATGTKNLEVINAFLQGKTNGKTSKGNYMVPSISDGSNGHRKGDWIYTMYNDPSASTEDPIPLGIVDPNEEKSIIEAMSSKNKQTGGSPVEGFDGNPITYSIGDISTLIVPMKGANVVKGALSKMAFGAEKNGGTTGKNMTPWEMNTASNSIDEIIKNPTALKQALYTKFGANTKSFFDEVTTEGGLSAEMYGSLSKIAPQNTDGTLKQEGVLKGIDATVDGEVGISLQDLSSPANMAILQKSLFSEGDANYSEKFTKEVFVPWAVGKVNEAQAHGAGLYVPSKRNLLAFEQKKISTINTLRKVVAKGGVVGGFNISFAEGDNKTNKITRISDGSVVSPQTYINEIAPAYKLLISQDQVFKGDWESGSAVSTETVTDSLNSNVYYETGEGGKINGGLIQDAYNKYTSGESFSTYDDSFTFTPKGSGWTVTGPTQDPKTKEFTGPVTTRSASEEEMVKKMGFKKQASRLGFEGIKEKTAATNPITDYKKEGDKWYYIKGGQKKEVDASNFERLEAQTLIALARGKK